MKRNFDSQKQPKRHGSGCLGCFTGAIFFALACVALVIALGKGALAVQWLERLPQEGGIVTVLLPNATEETQTTREAAASAEAVQTAEGVLATLEGSTSLFSDGVVRYGYTTLTSAEKISYITMAQCVFDMAEEVEVPAQGCTDLATIWPIVRADFPEIFWVDTSLTRTVTCGEVQSIYFVPTYHLTAQARAKQQARIDAMATCYLQSVASDASDYQKVKAAYEFVVQKVSYLATEYDQTLYGALGEGQAVCAGYARAVQYLLGCAGVACGYVSGEAVGEEGRITHAWNFVEIAGEYYYLDATWGEDNWGTGADYSYLCVNSTDLARTHFATEIYPLPAVNGTAYNYYRVEGTYLEYYSASGMQDALAAQVPSDCYTVRFASAQALQDALQGLVEQKEIYQLLRNLNVPTDSISYTYKEILCTLTIYPDA